MRHLPDIDQFAGLAEEAFNDLPPGFRNMCGNLSIRVADFADRETLDHFGMTDPYQLSGLYHGVDLTQKSVGDPVAFPDQVWLYRKPILAEWADRGDVSLKFLIAHVLVHEIGHHFGLSDADMHAIEDAAES
ncbi:metallopeptidase family protein [Hyphobacterium sp.]|jgi:predicted Zn-dependent protease with MMP-like domain|uniref:metallopeptidase family protein n=1 Tax=Hyphobacterium sp. TaxID=2004662 RepID=UPI003BABC32A